MRSGCPASRGRGAKRRTLPGTPSPGEQPCGASCVLKKWPRLIESLGQFEW
jgi:hypothetical protein